MYVCMYRSVVLYSGPESKVFQNTLAVPSKRSTVEVALDRVICALPTRLPERLPMGLPTGLPTGKPTGTPTGLPMGALLCRVHAACVRSKFLPLIIRPSAPQSPFLSFFFSPARPIAPVFPQG